jgi:cupin 2 domain-containing protein
MNNKGNIFKLPRHLGDAEIFEPLMTRKNITIERIISTGQTTENHRWYDQDRDEWVILLQGEAELTYPDEVSIRLRPGDYLFIPAHQKHAVTYTSTQPPCIWLAVHIPVIT